MLTFILLPLQFVTLAMGFKSLLPVNNFAHRICRKAQFCRNIEIQDMQISNKTTFNLVVERWRRYRAVIIF